MKKLNLLIAAILLVASASTTKAQGVFDKGDNVINATVGFGSPYTGTNYSPSIGFGVSFEHCFFDQLINGDFSVGIGGYVGFTTYKYEVPTFVGTYGWRYTTIAPAGRGTFHWTGVEKLDLYAGVHLGANIRISSEIGTAPGNVSPEGSGFYHSEFVGARYYFTDAFCVVAEAGTGIAFFNVGVGFKF